MSSIMLLNVPKPWKIERLGQLFFERREKVSDKEFKPLSVTKNGIVPQLEYVAKTDDGDNRKKVCVGDFVLNSRSDRKGSSGLSDYEGSVSLINIVLKPRHGYPRFLHYLLKCYAFQEEFYRFGQGIVADLWTTRFSELKGIQVGLPDFATQRVIANFLDRETARIDQLVEKKQWQAALLGLQRQTLISSAVTIGFDPDVQLIDTGSPYLPQIPVHWTMPRLKQIATLRGGLTLGRAIPIGTPTRTVPYLRLANVQAGWIDLNEITTIEASETEIQRFSLQAGDVLMNEGGDNDKLGRGVVWQAQLQPCLHQNHVFVARPFDLDIGEWLALSTNAKHGRDFTYLNSKQSTNLASIAKSKLEQFPIALPPADERRMIISRLSMQLDRSKAAENAIVATIIRLRERRSALITAAVTGQIDVATWGKRGSTDRRLEQIEAGLSGQASAERQEALA
jgi:type I restriction enzyme S subunit